MSERDSHSRYAYPLNKNNCTVHAISMEIAPNAALHLPDRYGSFTMDDGSGLAATGAAGTVGNEEAGAAAINQQALQTKTKDNLLNHRQVI